MNNGDRTTHVELIAADGSKVTIETFLDDGELHIEIYRGEGFNPVLRGEFTAKADA